MKGINYLAALGTIFIFLGWILISAARQRTTISKEGYIKTEKPKKLWLMSGGIISIFLGLALIIKATMLC